MFSDRYILYFSNIGQEWYHTNHYRSYKYKNILNGIRIDRSISSYFFLNSNIGNLAHKLLAHDYVVIVSNN